MKKTLDAWENTRCNFCGFFSALEKKVSTAEISIKASKPEKFKDSFSGSLKLERSADNLGREFSRVKFAICILI